MLMGMTVTIVLFFVLIDLFHFKINCNMDKRCISLSERLKVLLCQKLAIVCKYVSFVTWPNMMPPLLPASMST